MKGEEKDGVQCEAPGSETTISIKGIKPIKDIQIGEILEDIDFMIYSKKYKYYGVTIKPCSTIHKLKYQKDPQLLAELAIQLASVNKFAINELHFEYTTEKKHGKYPHIHFTALKSTSLFKFYQKGFSIYIEPIYNYNKWISYCKKDQDKIDYSFIPDL